MVEELWLTDELRLEKPEVLDEARNALYFVDGLMRRPVTDVLVHLVGLPRHAGGGPARSTLGRSPLGRGSAATATEIPSSRRRSRPRWWTCR